MAKHNQAKFRALANMGDVLIKMNNLEEAIKVYQKQLTLSKQLQDKALEASSYGSLGVCHRLLKRFDKSLGFHTQVSQKRTFQSMILWQGVSLISKHQQHLGFYFAFYFFTSFIFLSAIPSKFYSDINVCTWFTRQLGGGEVWDWDVGQFDQHNKARPSQPHYIDCQ